MTKQVATNITWHSSHVKREVRNRLLKQTGATIWFTGLSACGKSTIAVTLEHALMERGHLSYVLDGDNIRHGLNKNLGFSPEDRNENIRRIAEVAKLFADAGVLICTSFISPYRADRERARRLHKEAGVPFVEVYVKASVETCAQRDPKGLYKKARAGEIAEFTGISAPYEEPLDAEIVLDTEQLRVEQSAQIVLDYLTEKGVLLRPEQFKPGT